MEGKQKHKAGWALNAGPLTSQKLFWTALLASAFVVFGAATASVWDLPFDPSPAGVRNLLSHIRDVVPLAALAVAIIVLIARAHATVQTAEQISKANTQINTAIKQVEIATLNNAFANYYKHLEIFTQKFHLAAQGNYAIDLVALYHHLYPDNGPTSFSAIPEASAVKALTDNGVRLNDFSAVTSARQEVTMGEFMTLLKQCFVHPSNEFMRVAQPIILSKQPLSSVDVPEFDCLGNTLFRIASFAQPNASVIPAHIADTTVADQGPAPE